MVRGGLLLHSLGKFPWPGGYLSFLCYNPQGDIEHKPRSIVMKQKPLNIGNHMFPQR